MGRPKALRIVDKRMERVKRHHVHTRETKAALLIQRCYRGHCVRREVGDILDVVRKIQAHFRGSHVRREVAEAGAAAEAVQRVLRGHQSRGLAAALRADRERRRADERRRMQQDAERARQLPAPPESDDEDEAEEAGLSRSDRSRRGAARSMLFQMAQEGSTRRDVENIEGALQVLGANVRNKMRATALHLASGVGFVPAVVCLLGHGASTNVHDKPGRTPLLLACRHGHRQVAAELLRAGAYANDHGASGSRSPMTAAIDRNDAALADMLAAAGAHVPATHAARGLLLGMRAKARSGGGGADSACQELIRGSLELEGGEGYLTRLWEVVDTSAPNFCSSWPERELVEWLRPRLKLEFSETIGKRSHDDTVRRARVVGASMLEREARHESERCRAQVAASGSSSAFSVASSSAPASPGSVADSKTSTSTPRSAIDGTSHGSASPGSQSSISVSSQSSNSDTAGAHDVTNSDTTVGGATQAEPCATSQARLTQFKKARKFLQMQERRRARVGNEARIEETRQRMKRAEKAQIIENASKKQLEQEIAEREAAARSRAEAAAAYSRKHLPRLLRLAVKSGLATEAQVDELEQNVADGYMSAERSVEMWEDQLEKAGVLKNTRLKRERRLASEAARQLIGKRVDILNDADCVEKTIRDLVARGFIPSYDVDYNRCAGTRGQVFQRSGTLAVVQLDSSNVSLAFPCELLTVVNLEDAEEVGSVGATAEEGGSGDVQPVQPRRQKPLGKLISGSVEDSYRLTPTADPGRPKTPSAFKPDGWEQNFIGMRQKELAEDSDFALSVLRQTAEEERVAYERSVEYKKKLGPRALAAEGIASRKAVAVTEFGEKRLVFAVQEAKETRDEMIARVRKEDAEKKRQRKLAEEREDQLWKWGGERPTSKEERRVERTEHKSLKQKLKEKKAKQAKQTGVTGGTKNKWSEHPPTGVYRVLCEVSLHETVEVVSEIVAEVPAGILVEVTVVEPEPGIARLIEAGNAMVGSRQHWRAYIAGIDFNGWCTMKTPKMENLVHVRGLSKEEQLEIDSLEDDLVGLHQRRLALQPVLKKRAQVAAHRAQALNSVADQLEELDDQLEQTWQPWRKKKLEREATHLEQKARAIAEAQRIRDPKDSRRLEEIEMVMEDKQDRLRLLRLVQTKMEEERTAAAAREAAEAAAKEEEERRQKEQAEREAAETAKRLPSIHGGPSGPGNHMMLRRRTGVPPAGGVSAAGMLPSLVTSDGGDGPPPGALRDRRRVAMSPLAIAMPSPSSAARASSAGAGLSLMGMGVAAGAARVLRRAKGGGIVDEADLEEAAMHKMLERAIVVARSYGDDRFDEVLARELAKEGQKQSQMQQEVEQKAMVERLKRFGKPNYALAAEGLPSDVETWDTAQVLKWAKALGVGKRAYVLAARDVDGYALLWMAPESIVSMLCEGESEKKKKSTMAALETLRRESAMAKHETAAAHESKRFERLLTRAVKFGVVDESAAEKIGDSVRNGQESRGHYVSMLSKKLQAYRYELS